MTPIADVTARTKPVLQKWWMPVNKQAPPHPLDALSVVSSADHRRRELMGTVTGRLDGYLPLAPESVLDELNYKVQLGQRAPDAPVPPSNAEWVGRFRRIGAAKLRHHGLTTDLIQDAMLVTSELATNALRYGNGLVEFRLIIASDTVVIVVTDGALGTPEVRRTSIYDESGRGMFLIDAYSTDWGISPDCTATWCAFALPERGRR